MKRLALIVFYRWNISCQYSCGTVRVRSLLYAVVVVVENICRVLFFSAFNPLPLTFVVPAKKHSLLAMEQLKPTIRVSCF